MGAIFARSHDDIASVASRKRKSYTCSSDDQCKKPRRQTDNQRRVHLYVGGKLFVTSPLTLCAFGPSYFDLLLDDDELEASPGNGDEVLPPLDFQCPLAFERLHSCLQLARTDLLGALKQIRGDLLGDHGGSMQALLQRLELDWVSGWGARMPERLSVSSSTAAAAYKLPQRREGFDEWLAGGARGLAGVLAHLSTAGIALPVEYSQADATCATSQLHTYGGTQGKFHFSEELNTFASTCILSNMESGATCRQKVARVTACALFQERQRVEDFPAYSPQLAEVALWRVRRDEESFCAYLADGEEEMRIQLEDDYEPSDPTETPEPLPQVAEVGLRRLVFDLEPQRLLQFEGAFLVFEITAPKAWRTAEVFFSFASDLSDDVDTLETQICFGGGKTEFVECRVGPVRSSGRRPCGRLLSVWLIPCDYPTNYQHDYRPNENAFSWSLRAVELYGHVLEVPEEVLPKSVKPLFAFDSRSQVDYIRVAATA